MYLTYTWGHTSGPATSSRFAWFAWSDSSPSDKYAKKEIRALQPNT